MVKIRLQRLGNKGRPFYRVVISKSEAGRNGAAVENIGIYNPISQPKEIRIDEARALYWLRNGAEPTETTAYLLNKLGILPKFLEERPAQKRKYKFLDRTTAAISKRNAVEVPGAAKKDAPAKAEVAPAAVPVEDVVEPVVVESPVAEETPVVVEAPVVEEAPATAEEIVAETEAPAVEEAPAATE